MSVTIEHIEKIYFQFRKAQSDHFGRGFRMPKSFEQHFNNRFKEQNKKKLIKITGWFLTKWQSIDPYTYFRCGFDLFDKRFSYMKFFHEKIILLYINRDKNKKREIRVTKQALVDSAFFVKKYIKAKGFSNLDDYIHYRKGNRKIAVEHYLKNKIDASFFVFLLGKGMLLTDSERCDIPYIQTNFRKLKFNLEDIRRDFLKKLGDKIDE
jgi:hypothetical protein